MLALSDVGDEREGARLGAVHAGADVEQLASVLALSADLRLRCDEASVMHAVSGA